VQRARQQFLARPAFPQQQHVGVALRRSLHRQQRVLERGILAEHRLEAEAALVVVLQQDVVGEQPPTVDRALQ